METLFDVLKQEFGVVFAEGHKLFGEPTLKIIKPVATWTLAAGVTYDPHQDQFINDDGGVVSVVYATQPSVTVDYLPSRQNNAMTIGIPGITTVTATEHAIILQWTAAVQTAIAQCWGVLMGGGSASSPAVLYRVKDYEVFPVGVTSPIELRVSLVKANVPDGL